MQHRKTAMKNTKDRINNENKDCNIISLEFNKH